MHRASATGADLLAAPGRLTTALARADRSEQPAPLGRDAAIAETARRLRSVLDTHGPGRGAPSTSPAR